MGVRQIQEYKWNKGVFESLVSLWLHPCETGDSGGYEIKVTAGLAGSFVGIYIMFIT